MPEFVTKADAEQVLKALGCTPIPTMQLDREMWWNDPFGGKFCVQLGGPNKLPYRVQLDYIHIGIAKLAEAQPKNS